MTSIDDIAELVGGDNGLATVSLARADGSVHASVVNAGVLNHPVADEPVVGLVVRGDSYKLRRLRQLKRAAVTFRVGWRWAGVEGPVDLIGPVDPLDGVDPSDVPRLLREIFIAAGGSHDDWQTYDRVMADEGRTAVLVHPQRLLGNG